MGYPVISTGEFAHRLSFINLFGEDASQEQLDEVSLEKSVGPHTPPVFVWHTVQDASVPVENAMLFASALRQNNLPFELHIFPFGGHGSSTSDESFYMMGHDYINSDTAQLYRKMATKEIIEKTGKTAITDTDLLEFFMSLPLKTRSPYPTP